MEAFEQFVGLALEQEGFVVSPAVKFDVQLQTKKAAYAEFQKHGYEVDLVAARADRLVLATVKSFFGSRGVVAEHVMGTSPSSRGNSLYKLLNNQEIQIGVVNGACDRFGYSLEQVELRLYVGKFAGSKSGKHEKVIKDWASTQLVGAGPIQVVGLDELVAPVVQAAASKQYRDNPVLVTMKVLEAGGLLALELPDP